MLFAARQWRKVPIAADLVQRIMAADRDSMAVDLRSTAAALVQRSMEVPVRDIIVQRLRLRVIIVQLLRLRPGTIPTITTIPTIITTTQGITIPEPAFTTALQVLAFPLPCKSVIDCFKTEKLYVSKR